MDQNLVEKKAVHDAGAVQPKGNRSEGNIHISEDVIVELAKKTILGISNILPAHRGIASKLGLGRKMGDGVRVVVEEGKIPSMTVDAYILAKYGHRIPDLAWDVQEKIKTNLERYTGYIVKAVNINVQGIYLEEPKDAPDESGLDAADEG